MTRAQSRHGLLPSCYGVAGLQMVLREVSPDIAQQSVMDAAYLETENLRRSVKVQRIQIEKSRALPPRKCRVCEAKEAELVGLRNTIVCLDRVVEALRDKGGEASGT